MNKRKVRIYKDPGGNGQYINKTAQFLQKAQAGMQVNDLALEQDILDQLTMTTDVEMIADTLKDKYGLGYFDALDRVEKVVEFLYRQDVNDTKNEMLSQDAEVEDIVPIKKPLYDTDLPWISDDDTGWDDFGEESEDDLAAEGMQQDESSNSTILDSPNGRQAHINNFRRGIKDLGNEYYAKEIYDKTKQLQQETSALPPMNNQMMPMAQEGMQMEQQDIENPMHHLQAYSGSVSNIFKQPMNQVHGAGYENLPEARRGREQRQADRQTRRVARDWQNMFGDMAAGYAGVPGLPNYLQVVSPQIVNPQMTAGAMSGQTGPLIDLEYKKGPWWKGTREWSAKGIPAAMLAGMNPGYGYMPMGMGYGSSWNTTRTFPGEVIRTKSQVLNAAADPAKNDEATILKNSGIKPYAGYMELNPAPEGTEMVYDEQGNEVEAISAEEAARRRAAAAQAPWMFGAGNKNFMPTQTNPSGTQLIDFIPTETAPVVGTESVGTGPMPETITETAPITGTEIIPAATETVGANTETIPFNLSEEVQKTLRGEYGSGAARKAALGENYAQVQAEINKMFAASTPKAKTTTTTTPKSFASAPATGVASPTYSEADYQAEMNRIKQKYNSSDTAGKEAIISNLNKLYEETYGTPENKYVKALKDELEYDFYSYDNYFGDNYLQEQNSKNSSDANKSFEVNPELEQLIYDKNLEFLTADEEQQFDMLNKLGSVPDLMKNPILSTTYTQWWEEIKKKYGYDRAKILGAQYAGKRAAQDVANNVSDFTLGMTFPAYGLATQIAPKVADYLGYQQGGMVNTSQMDPNTLTKFVYGGDELPISPIVAYDNNDIQSKNVDDPFMYRMGGLYKYDGINNSQVTTNDYEAWLKQKAEQEALAEYNDYMNRTNTGDASTFMKYEANPNDAVYQQILQRKLGTTSQPASTETTTTRNYNYGYGAGYPMTGGYSYPTAPTIGQQIRNMFSPFKYNPATGGNYDFTWMSQQGPARTASGAIFQPQGQLQGMVPVAGTNADGTATQPQAGYMYDYKFEKGPWWSGKKTMTLTGRWVDPNNPNAGTTAGGASANTTADNIAEGYNPEAVGPGYSGYNADTDGNGLPDYLQTPNPRETQTGTSTSTNTVEEEMSPRERRQQKRIQRRSSKETVTEPEQSTTSTPATGTTTQPAATDTQVNNTGTTQTTNTGTTGATNTGTTQTTNTTNQTGNPDWNEEWNRETTSGAQRKEQAQKNQGVIFNTTGASGYQFADGTPVDYNDKTGTWEADKQEANARKAFTEQGIINDGMNNNTFPDGTPAKYSYILKKWVPKRIYGGASNYMEFGGYVPEFNPGGQFSGTGPFNPNSSNLETNPNQAITGPCTEFEVQNPNSPCYDPNYKPSALQNTTPEDFSVTYDINKARTLDTNKIANAGQFLGAGIRGISAGLNDSYNTNYLASRSPSDSREPVNQLDYRGGYSGLSQRNMSKGQGAGSTGFNYVVGEAAFVKKGGELKFRQGGVYDLTQEEIGQILAAGGQIKFI